MPHYHSLGKIPHKRHTQFRKPDGGLYREELVSTEGFSNIYSLVYHVHPPTAILEVGESWSVEPKVVDRKNIKHRSFLTFKTEPKDDFLDSRKILFLNNDLNIGVAAPRKSVEGYFYKNSTSDEMLFIHEGTGNLKSGFGNLRFGPGDYLIIPRGVIYQMEFDGPENRILFVESHSPIVTPKRYRNQFGQLLEHSPFCERDFRKPENLVTHDEKGAFKILIKKEGMIHPFTYDSHPFDFIGWDGYFFPYAFSIHDFEPITGRVHQPPPVHQNFEAHNFVVCSFCPRLFDYHPQSIPAPYWHSNVDSDEILYYVEGEFMSRKHVEKGMISLHPMGIPHGPHPGSVEKSIGAKETLELAVMVDTFRPLWITEDAFGMEDPGYLTSWLE
ncbi:MAG: homogentisate 1,2-dioxygenase [Bacteroidia bacterium]|nr:homogentisate 1,2-dioxygenase [Bacteroidia bacterium]